MPKVLFWNVERLGESTDPRIKEMVSWVVRHLMENHEVSDVYLCEVTSGFDLVVSSADATPVSFGKQGYRNRRSGRRTSAQLGYAHIHAAEDEPPEPAKITLKSHSEVFGIRPAGFAHAVDPIRHLVRHGRDTYVLHANSGKGGGAPFQIIRAWVQVYYAAVGGAPVVFGDLNCEPGVLQDMRDRYIDFLEEEFRKGDRLVAMNNALRQWSVAAAIEALRDMQIVDGGPTFKVHSPYYHGQKDATIKTYDYAVTKNANEVYVEAFDYRDMAGYRSEFTTKVMGGLTVGGTGCPSDHLPILVSWGDV